MRRVAQHASGRLTVEECATCSAACPVHTDTRAYVDLITQGRYEEAFEAVREFNPFPGVCGLICHHPCEEACRRSAVDDPVALRHLKRFVVEQAAHYRRTTRRVVARTRDETVGIVGAGPAGLTVACDCARAGHPVTVYEATDQAGGLLFWGVPRYRLPAPVLEEDLADILALGIEVRMGDALGRDVTLGELQTQHDAVVLALGLSRSRVLPIEGADHPELFGALSFLAQVAAGEAPDVGDTVIVVGGGNVAIDVARTAARLGAQAVRVVCLESLEEMPAWDWECREALEEGIEFIHRRGPVRVVVGDVRISGLEVREVARAFDDDGRFAPQYVDANRSIVPGQTVIFAIGQEADLSGIEGADLGVGPEGLLPPAPGSGLFACGEVVTGPGSAIEAVADAHRCARAVIGSLQPGRRPRLTGEAPDEVDELPGEVIAGIRPAARTPIRAIPPAERVRNFAPFEFSYEEREAIREAWRCLSCAAGADVDLARCASCLACARICPFDVPLVDRGAVMRSEMCQSCGLCAVECPALAITVERLEGLDLTSRIARLLGSADEPVGTAEIVCARDMAAREELTEGIAGAAGMRVARFPVSCAGLADEVAMMRPFEFGVRTVSVVTCGECAFEGAVSRLAARVERTRALLEEAGIGGERLVLRVPEPAGEGVR